MSSYAAATPDRGVRLATSFMWGLAAVLAGGGLVVVAARLWSLGGVLLVSSAATVAMTLFCKAAAPVGYDTGRDWLVVRRRGGASRRYDGAFGPARRGKLGIRVGGNGGVYGYTGRYRADGRFVSSYVTDRSRVVLVRVGSAELALSPVEPDGFVRDLGGGDA